MEECMSLRDFNNAPFPDDPRALHNDPLGNSAGLESFHTVQPEDIAPNNTPKIVGAVAVALMVGVAGIALYASNSGKHPAAVVATATPATPVVSEPLPAPAAAAPDASAPLAPPAADKSPASAPSSAKGSAMMEASAPVKEASMSKKHRRTASISASTASSNAAPSSAAADRMAADTNQSTVQPQQQQAIAPPSPSPSDLASNNTQSNVAVSPNATSASDIPAQPQAAPQPPAPAPAQEQSAGAAQAAGQVNQ
jgi:hypothetical protein